MAISGCAAMTKVDDFAELLAPSPPRSAPKLVEPFADVREEE